MFSHLRGFDSPAVRLCSMKSRIAASTIWLIDGANSILDAISSSTAMLLTVSVKLYAFLGTVAVFLAMTAHSTAFDIFVHHPFAFLLDSRIIAYMMRVVYMTPHIALSAVCGITGSNQWPS